VALVAPTGVRFLTVHAVTSVMRAADPAAEVDRILMELAG